VAPLKIIIGNKNYSTWSLRGWLAVKHTGLPFEEVKIDLYTPHSKAELLKHSPTGMVPALIDGDITVWDSLAIIDYCATTTPEKFWWPKDRAAYAFARSISAEMHSGFMGLRTHASMNLKARWTGLTLGESVAKDVARIDALWSEAREKFGAGGDFLFGEFSAADMMFAPVVTRFETYGFEISPTARTYMDAVLAHPLMVEWTKEGVTETAIIEASEIPADTTRLG
jgi:glutathione S-transferase